MGLDISVYSYIEEVKDVEKYDEDALCEFYNTYNNNNFLIQLDGLKTNTYYRITTNSEYYSFHAGSYGSYNSWRNQLSIMIGYESAQDAWNNFNYNIRCYKLKKIQKEPYIKPFILLIYFSDCEGYISSNISKILYEDFVKYDNLAMKQDKYFYEKYCYWKEAFRIASEDGFVRFG